MWIDEKGSNIQANIEFFKSSLFNMASKKGYSFLHQVVEEYANYYKVFYKLIIMVDQSNKRFGTFKIYKNRELKTAYVILPKT